jgi:arylsulfatase A-like enzyme
MRRRLLILAVFSCWIVLAESARAQTTPPNIVMIIADDVGRDAIGTYDGPAPAPTPNIDQLAAEGVQFSNAWANPVCAPTRGTIQTGRYGHRTMLLRPEEALADAEVTIPEVLAAAGSTYKSALVGKWGLSTSSGTDATGHAVRAGYDYFAGLPGALIGSYFNWTRHEARYAPEICDPDSHQSDACIIASSSVVSITSPAPSGSHYATAVNVDDAIGWLADHEQAPWFLVLSFNAAHKPLHLPPDALHPNGTPCPSGQEGACYRAMIEAMDDEIGRLRAWLEQEQEFDQTIVIFVGDNGSEADVVGGDPLRWKGTLFEGGLMVPLIVRGPGVVSSGQSGIARVSNALVNTSDLFMTVLDLAGVAGSVSVTHDSFSLVPILKGFADALRQYAFAEVRYLVEGKAIRNRGGYKLVVAKDFGGAQTIRWFFHNLQSDPGEAANLVQETGTSGPVLITPNSTVQTQLDRLAYLLGPGMEGVSIPPPPNLPPANLDRDADAVKDSDDNCRDVGQDWSQRCDTDGDGYGNTCDGDFDENNAVISSDFSMYFIPAFKGWDPAPWPEGMDMDCNGAVISTDFGMYFIPQFQITTRPGPSGLACAGTTPCPEP